jgi:hypothetical protein
MFAELVNDKSGGTCRYVHGSCDLHSIRLRAHAVALLKGRLCSQLCNLLSVVCGQYLTISYEHHFVPYPVTVAKYPTRRLLDTRTLPPLRCP